MVGVSRLRVRDNRARSCAALVVNGLLLIEGAGTLCNRARDTRRNASVKEGLKYRLDRWLETR